MQDVPDEDGLVYIENNAKFKSEEVLNRFVDCEIIDVSDYDLIGKIIH